VQAFGRSNPAASVLRLQRKRLHSWQPAGLADAATPAVALDSPSGQDAIADGKR